MEIEGFRCLVCEKKLSLNETEYICPYCGGNLDVVYKYKRISRKIFEKNRDFSIFRYEELLPVKNNGRIPLKIGFTPIYKFNLLGLNNLYLKDDGRNPSASFKDRASAIVLLKAMDKKVKVIIGASTGNAGSSMACLSASVGMPSIIFVPETAPQGKVAQLLIFGSKVFAVKGTYDDAFDLCLEVSKRFKFMFNRNTGFNPWTREGKKTVSFEIVEQLNWRIPDYVFVPVGDGNIISGVWKGFKDMYYSKLIDKLPKIVAVQSNKSNSVYKTWMKYFYKKKIKKVDWRKIKIVKVKATTIADSISVDLPRDGIAALRAIIESNGFAIEVSDLDIKRSIRKIAVNTGIFSEPAGATGFAGVEKAYSLGLIKKNDIVVTIITGNGLKDIKCIFDICKSPLRVEKDIEKVEKLIKRVI
ncbi:MAG: threonine synthase [Caldiserica bacterium]|nr:MAG: threonine synthase [Caldisericota bacterium]